MPSESRQELQMKAEATATSSSKPSAGAMVAPVTETPVTETLGAETPVVETPAAPSFLALRACQRAACHPPQ